MTFARSYPIQGKLEFPARRGMALDADYDNLDTWSKAVFAKYPNAKLHQERLSRGGISKVAFVGNDVVAKWVSPIGTEFTGMRSWIK